MVKTSLLSLLLLLLWQEHPLDPAKWFCSGDCCRVELGQETGSECFSLRYLCRGVHSHLGRRYLLNRQTLPCLTARGDLLSAGSQNSPIQEQLCQVSMAYGRPGWLSLSPRFHCAFSSSKQQLACWMSGEEVDLQSGHCISEVRVSTNIQPGLSPEWVWTGFSSPVPFENVFTAISQ